MSSEIKINEPSYHDKGTVREIIIGAPKCEIIFGALSISTFFQYYDSNIGLFSVAPQLVIAHPTLK